MIVCWREMWLPMKRGIERWMNGYVPIVLLNGGCELIRELISNDAAVDNISFHFRLRGSERCYIHRRDKVIGFLRTGKCEQSNKDKNEVFHILQAGGAEDTPRSRGYAKVF